MVSYLGGTEQNKCDVLENSDFLSFFIRAKTIPLAN
jgi:hypothetical protein